MVRDRGQEPIPVASTVVPASPESVFEVLSDPTSYPDWLVGAQRIRGVDRDWPAVGSRFRHAIGFGPALVPGSTSVRRIVPPSQLVLTAGMGPLGEAWVRFDLEPVRGGTQVRLSELPVRGPVRLVWRLCRRLVGAGLWGRNAISLSELSDVVTRRSDDRGGR